MPVLMLLLCFGVQVAALVHASSVASLAADKGAVSGAAYSTNGGSPTSAVAEASRVVLEIGGHFEVAPSAWIENGQIFVTVEVAVPRAVPFMPHVVRRTAVAPVEVFLSEDSR
jgi:hypothetical protein